MKQKALELFKYELEFYGINVPLSEIIGKTVCLIGDEATGDGGKYNILVLTKVLAIIAGGDPPSETLTVGNWSGLCDLQLANGGKISLVFENDEMEQKGMLKYSGPDCYHSKDTEYFVQVHFME